MTEQHIARAFDRDLDAIQNKMMKMAGQVELALDNAARALDDRNLELAEQVRKNDKAIDLLHEEVKTDVARVLATRAPTAGDLRTVLSALSISSNLERCGDYAKNMAKRTPTLAELPPINEATATLHNMARTVGDMMTQALTAYVERDAELAEQVRLRDLEVDQIYNTLFRSLLTHMMEDPRSITACMHLHFIAKNIERAGDHVTSIAEQCIYLVTGQMPDDERPKGDVTAQVAEVDESQE